MGQGDAAGVMELTPEMMLSGVEADSCCAVTSTPKDCSTKKAPNHAGRGLRHMGGGVAASGGPLCDEACASGLTLAAGLHVPCHDDLLQEVRTGGAALRV